LQKSPIKDTIFCKKRPIYAKRTWNGGCVYMYTVAVEYTPEICLYIHSSVHDGVADMGWLRLVGSVKL